MDPLENIVFEKDTTFMMMLGAHKRGHEVYYLPKDGISLVEGKVYFHVTQGHTPSHCTICRLKKNSLHV